MKWAKRDSIYENCISEIEEVLRSYRLELHIDYLRDPDTEFTLKVGDRSLNSGFNPGVTNTLPRTCEEEQLYLFE